MKKRYLALIFLAIISLGLFSYNYWSYSCGRCNAASLWAISLPAGILIAANLFALASLLVVKMRQQRNARACLCHCGARILPDWQFCPNCGQALQL